MNDSLSMAVVLSESLGLGYQFLDYSLNFPQSAAVPYLPCFHTVHNMASVQLPHQEMPMPEIFSDDPVIKAVYNNIVGNIMLQPEPRKKMIFNCDVCKLEFLSKVVLEMHLSGSKHQRKLKAKDLMQSLEKNESGFEKDAVSGVIRCTVCDITVNSPQLLATHIAGNKHRIRKRKREEEILSPGKKLCLNSEEIEQSNGVSAVPNQSSEEANQPHVKKREKKERPQINFDIPSCVTKLEDSKSGGNFLCNPCQAHCNSDIQLSQHLTSKKHLDKVSTKTKSPLFTGRGRFTRGFRGAGSYRGVGEVSGGRGRFTSNKLYMQNGTYPREGYNDDGAGRHTYNDDYDMHPPATNYGVPSFPVDGPIVPPSRGRFGRGSPYNARRGMPAKRPLDSLYSAEPMNYGERKYQNYEEERPMSGGPYSGYNEGNAPYTYTQPLSQNFVSGGSFASRE